MSIPQLPPGADVWAIPAAPAPPPLTSNLVDPPSNGNIVIVPLSVFIVIATIFVLLRLYVRYFVQHALGLDDCEHPIVSRIEGDILTLLTVTIVIALVHDPKTSKTCRSTDMV